MDGWMVNVRCGVYVRVFLRDLYNQHILCMYMNVQGLMQKAVLEELTVARDRLAEETERRRQLEEVRRRHTFDSRTHIYVINTHMYVHIYPFARVCCTYTYERPYVHMRLCACVGVHRNPI